MAGWYVARVCPDCGLYDKLTTCLFDVVEAFKGWSLVAQQPKLLQLEFDGACEMWSKYAGGTGRSNPGGIATFGWRVLEWQDGDTILRAKGMGEVARGMGKSDADKATNNLAEYGALLAGLQALQDLGWQDCALLVTGDSQLVIYQLSADPRTGRQWKCNKLHLRKLRDQVRELLPEMTFFHWWPREMNEAADTLSKLAYQRAKQRQPGAWAERRLIKASVAAQEAI